MSSSTPYHQLNAPDSPADDSESDLDIDLQELDPVTTSSPTKSSIPQSKRKSREEQRATLQRTGRIALRKLRMGGFSRAGKQNIGYGGLGTNRMSYNEDEGLLDDERGLNGPRNSAGSADDDALLLPEHAIRARRTSLIGFDRMSELGSRLRLPRFLSNAGESQVPQDHSALEE